MIQFCLTEFVWPVRSKIQHSWNIPLPQRTDTSSTRPFSWTAAAASTLVKWRRASFAIFVISAPPWPAASASSVSSVTISVPTTGSSFSATETAKSIICITKPSKVHIVLVYVLVIKTAHSFGLCTQYIKFHPDQLKSVWENEAMRFCFVLTLWPRQGQGQWKWFKLVKVNDAFNLYKHSRYYKSGWIVLPCKPASWQVEHASLHISILILIKQSTQPHTHTHTKSNWWENSSDPYLPSPEDFFAVISFT